MENKNIKKNLRDTDVLIINDIYAVGLKYDKAIKSSPFVTYKSKNVENCKLIANKHLIPIYKNYIANDLYVLNVKESIPENMYHSIAQIFAEITVNSKNNFENLLEDAIFYANFETSLSLEFSPNLFGKIEKTKFFKILEHLRKEIYCELGLAILPINIEKNGNLATNQYSIKLNKNVLRTSEFVYTNISELLDNISLIIKDLRNLIIENAGDLITRRQIFQMFEKLDSQMANYSSKILQDVSINTIHAVLSNLLEEQVPILEIEKILETLCIYNGENENIASLTEQVRKSLSTTICERLVSTNGSLLVLRLSTDIEEKIAKIINKENNFCEATFLKNLITSIKNENNRIETDYGQIPTILCSSAIRSYMRMITKKSCRNSVISYEELNTNKNEAFKVKEIGLISE